MCPCCPWTARVPTARWQAALTDGTTGTAAAEQASTCGRRCGSTPPEALEPLGDTVLTGNTGTNLCDFNVLYIGTQE